MNELNETEKEVLKIMVSLGLNLIRNHDVDIQIGNGEYIDAHTLDSIDKKLGLGIDYFVI